MALRYLLISSVLFGLIPCGLSAQSSRPLYLEAGVGLNHFSLLTDFSYSIINRGQSSRVSSTGIIQPASAPGIHLGAQWAWKDRWHLKGRVAYSEGEALDDPYGNAGGVGIGGSSEVLTARPRSYRVTWSEALILYAPSHSYHWEWQFGTGLSYGYWRQQYLSSLEYDLQLDIYAVRRTTTAWGQSLGIPAVMQLQYFLNQHFKFGLMAQANLFFSGEIQAGIQVSLAYRLY